MTGTVVLDIRRRWDGTALSEDEHARVALRLRDAELCVEVDAPFYRDAAPAAPVGTTDRLWEHEVVEVFLADAGQRYLEIELGPHGHSLVLALDGTRNPVRYGLPISYAAQILPATAAGARPRFVGHARVPRAYLPQGVCRANAYAIHGPAQARCHHAHAGLPALAPDFHRLESFVPCRLDDSSR